MVLGKRSALFSNLRLYVLLNEVQRRAGTVCEEDVDLCHWNCPLVRSEGFEHGLASHLTACSYQA